MSRRTRPGRGRAAALIVLAALGTAACGSGSTPQVDVALALDMPESVPLREPLHMTYSWSPADGFTAPMEDYQVFVHARDRQGNVLFQDDHYPPEPTSQWTAGQAQTYERWVYVPEAIEVNEIEFVVGLYSPDGRALVRGDAGSWTDAVVAHALEVRLNDMQGVPAYIEGWHGQEGDAGTNWRWTEGLARAAFTNPRADATLHLTAHGPYDEVGAQELVLRAGDNEIARLEIGSAETFTERIEIPAAAMGDDDWVELTLEVTPVLVPNQLDPASADSRTLGLQVFNLYLSTS